MNSGEWIPIEELKNACTAAGIANDGPGSTMVIAIGGDRALYEPWHPSLETFYFRRKRWFRRAALTEGVNAIRKRGYRD